MSKPRMTGYSYPPAPGGLPAQSESPEGRARFTEAWALIPADVMRDIVTSSLPHWEATRAWVLARPMTGFSESFAHYLMEVTGGGGSDAPEPDSNAEAVLFVTGGAIRLTIDGTAREMSAGGYAYIPPGTVWQLRNNGTIPAVFHWVRKHYVAVEGVAVPPAFVTSDSEVAPTPMPDCNGIWATSRFVDPDDLRHDMHVNIVTFQPGGRIPFAETHVMEHALFVLQGHGSYLLNTDWVEVGPGDMMWLRAFCPQACIAKGDEPFRYLLYKDVNRHMPLSPGGLMRAR